MELPLDINIIIKIFPVEVKLSKIEWSTSREFRISHPFVDLQKTQRTQTLELN